MPDPDDQAIDDLDEGADDPHAMLIEARAKAERLVRELEARQAEVEANPPDLPAENLAMGRMAMTNAVAAAKRALAALDEARKIAQTERNQT
jgi:hypothetical protein